MSLKTRVLYVIADKIFRRVFQETNFGMEMILNFNNVRTYVINIGYI